MKKIHFLAFFIIFCTSISISLGQQSVVRLNGYVYDATSHEAIVGAYITANDVHYAETNGFGYFSMTVNKHQKLSVKIKYPSFEDFNQEVIINTQDTLINIFLKTHELQELVIRDKMTTYAKANVVTIPIERLKAIPMLLGQPDIIKALAFVPGVSTGTEGTAGLFVRGGTPDQNLILLDGGTVYNASHLFGFQSVFDPSAVKDVKLIKGGFPAQYGGRLSSIIDIKMKEGDNQKRHREFNIGLLNSGFLTEGPIKKGQSSYMMSGRAFYWGLFSLPTYKSSTKSDNKPFNLLYNYDLNFKINHQFKNQDRLFVSFYTGRDQLFSQYKAQDVIIKNDVFWQNKTGALRYTHLWAKRLFCATTLNFNTYDLNQNYKDKAIKLDNQSSFDKFSAIKELSLKQHFSLAHGRNNALSWGIESNIKEFTPNKISRNIKIKGIDSTISSNNYTVKTLDISPFVEEEIQWNKYINTKIGLRNSNYQVENKWYSYLEPRISTAINRNSSTLTFAYARTSQFIHLLSNNLIGLNSDIWVPSTNTVKPQIANQFNIGYTLDNNNDKKLSYTIEAYYKTLSNQIDYRQGIDFLSNQADNWQTAIEKNGQGRTYGLEFMVQKKTKRYNGWLSYTLSRSERKFDNINNKQWYPHKYDRSHNLNLTLEYKWSKNWTLASNFVIQSGTRITLPTAIYQDNTFLDINTNISTQNGIPIQDQADNFYEGRNNERLPAYHRLDLSFSRAFETRRKERKANIAFGVYNVYARNNPYTAYASAGGNTGDNTVPVSITGTSLFLFIPSISYNLKF